MNDQRAPGGAIRKLLRAYQRWTCRMLEAAAGSRGDYRTAHYWLRKAEEYR